MKLIMSNIEAFADWQTDRFSNCLTSKQTDWMIALSKLQCQLQNYKASSKWSIDIISLKNFNSAECKLYWKYTLKVNFTVFLWNRRLFWNSQLFQVWNLTRNVNVNNNFDIIKKCLSVFAQQNIFSHNFKMDLWENVFCRQTDRLS